MVNRVYLVLSPVARSILSAIAVRSSDVLLQKPLSFSRSASISLTSAFVKYGFPSSFIVNCNDNTKPYPSERA